MTPFDIRIPTSLYRTDDPMKIESLLREFADYLLEIYADSILEELSKESRYSKRWSAKSTEFKEYMRSKGYPETLDFSLSEIKSFFVVKKYKDHVLIEVSRRRRLGKGSLEHYLRLVEYGTSKFPARYLFTPVRRDLVLNLSYYWDNFYETHVESQTHKRRKTHYERYLESRRSS